MKFTNRFRATFKPLDKRGALQIALPVIAVLLVAAFGTYSLVASNAASAKGVGEGPAAGNSGVTTTGSGTTATGTGGTAPEPLAANIRILPAPGKATGNTKAISGVVEVSVPGTNLTKNQCAGQVSVAFATPSRVTAPSYKLKYVKPGAQRDGTKVQLGSCIANLSQDGFKSGEVVNISALLYNGKTKQATKFLKSPAVSKSYTIPGQQAVEMNVMPSLADNNKTLKARVEVKAPGVSLSSSQCLGKVTVTITHKTIRTKDSAGKIGSASLRYVVPKPGAADQRHYCVASLKLKNPQPGSTYTINAQLKATPYLQTAQASAAQEVPFPAKAVKQ